jgi:hypothetical protein
MKTIAIRISCALALLFTAQHVFASKTFNVAGDWTLCQDPDGSARDTMHFNADGTGKVVRADGRSTEFLYKVSGLSLSLLAHVGDKAIPIEMSISEDGRKLLAYSERTRNTSFYVHETEVAEFECSAK